MKALGVNGLAGGFSLGVAQAGFELVGQFEQAGGFGSRTLSTNFPGLPVHWAEVGDRRGESWPLDRWQGEIDFLYGCPACAGFSSSAAGTKSWANPDAEINDGIRQVFHAIARVQPEVACFESVPATFESEAGHQLLDPLRETLEASGYTTVVTLYNNGDAGVPQKRPRGLLWAARRGIHLRPAPPLGSMPTARDAIGDLENIPLQHEFEDFTAYQVSPKTRYQLAMRQGSKGVYDHRTLDYSPGLKTVAGLVPWGKTFKAVSDEDINLRYRIDGRIGRPGVLNRRLHPNLPAPTLTGGALMEKTHYAGPEAGAGEMARLLTIREVARLMGYPDTFRVPMPPGTATRVLTKAVSPLVARWAGIEASKHLEDPQGRVPAAGKLDYRRHP